MAELTGRAVRVTEKTLDMIADVNDGIRPEQECVDLPTYFVNPDDDDDYNQLITEEIFRDNYRFVEEEKPNEFAKVVEE